MENFLTAPQWKELLKEEFNEPYFLELKKFISSEKEAGKIIYPQDDEIFSAFNITDFNDVKVVIIGQDPYHGENQAHGMSFSVKPGVKIPPSLRNIYKELNSDINFEIPDHGCLQEWAKQGVLMLNACLTVEASLANSHQKKGWEQFTDKVIELINDERENVVFLLWGSPAQKKAKKVDENKHHILKSVHPSPLAAYRGFFGCQHFSKTNEFLKSQGEIEINWQLPLSL